MKNDVLMDQLILFHKSNQKLVCEMMMDHYIPQIKHPLNFVPDRHHLPHQYIWGLKMDLFVTWIGIDKIQLIVVHSWASWKCFSLSNWSQLQKHLDNLAH
jgi:hypothetical protein